MLASRLNKLLSGAWRPQRRHLNLALQGGGAHGAFTWGVLDQLLEDARIVIGGVSGTSAGAVNAVMLADGLAQSGPEGARERLADFWRAASLGGSLPELQRAVVERLFPLLPQRATLPWFGDLARFLSPYDLNPLNINPLKDLIGRFVDFERIRSGDRNLFITATNVLTGEPRIFARHEVTPEVVMASACLPLMFRAVEIEGVPYWDGGYSGNPVVLPFLESGSCADILIVQINPRERAKLPTTANEIMTRMNEITFNAPLIAELRSKLKVDFEFFLSLRKRGQRAAQRFLDAHFNDIGRRSTIDLMLPAETEPA
jgi:NTE family protein